MGCFDTYFIASKTVIVRIVVNLVNRFHYEIPAYDETYEDALLSF